MEFIQCREGDFGRVNAFYREVVAYLEDHINYPKWSDDHPSEQDITNAIGRGTQYICTDGETVIGAVILNDDPEGYYEAGKWSRTLDRGEYLIVHALAVKPDLKRGGVGTFMIKECIRVAKADGYKAVRLDTVPDNHPANGLYLKNDFSYVGTEDLRRDIPEIPLFNLYELNL